MTLARRRINVKFELGQGSFGEDPAGAANTVELTGLRVSASIEKGGLPSFDRAQIRVWGLTASLMNQLTRLGKPLDFPRKNVVTLFAGDDGAGMSQVFQGTIWSAYGDFNAAPEASLNIISWSNVIDAAKPVPPISFPGGADVAVIMAQIAASMGKAFKNDGVTAHLANAYYPGTAMDQLKACAAAANCWVDASGDAVVIWPKDGVRDGFVPLINRATGLIGYPEYSDVGLRLRAIYGAGLTFGSRFKLETTIKPANGLWTILNLAYDLESELPNGRWDVTINAMRPPDGGGAN